METEGSKKSDIKRTVGMMICSDLFVICSVGFTGLDTSDDEYYSCTARSSSFDSIFVHIATTFGQHEEYYDLLHSQNA